MQRAQRDQGGGFEAAGLLGLEEARGLLVEVEGVVELALEAQEVGAVAQGLVLLAGAARASQQAQGLLARSARLASRWWWM